MVIQKGDYIKLSYTGKLENGTVFDTTDANVAREFGVYNEQASYGPETVVVGKGFVVSGLDEDLIGKEVGYHGTLTVPPEKGFGLRRIDQIETIPVKKFKEPIRPGMRVNVGGRTGTVENIAGGRARINFNSPLAGETLTYEYTIEAQIEERDEKIAAILRMFSGKDMDHKVKEDKVKVEVPKDFAFNQRWLLAKGAIASELMELEGIEKVVFQETYEKEEKKEAFEPVEAPAAGEEKGEEKKE
ncbi:MAG: putative FKBP-type peptidyl-prolyl cis-trans isomerase [Methanocella sp. PtaU1.Bin125]|nr:MAG: putative FKBP-type peptidyl-prolyl cis-trans isomerase [Methanocella sp. PtaU1.Bin125]